MCTSAPALCLNTRVLDAAMEKCQKNEAEHWPSIPKNVFLKKGMQKNKYQIVLNWAELKHLEAQFMC